MMKKIIALTLLISSLSAHKVYELIPSSNNEQVTLKITTHTEVSGFDSDGHEINLHSTNEKERPFKLKDAFYIGVRYENIPILNESLQKLEKQKERIDIVPALQIISEQIQNACSSKKWGYMMSGITGFFAIPAFIARAPHLSRKTIYEETVFGHLKKRYEFYLAERSLKNRLITSSVIGGIASLLALITHYSYKKTTQNYTGIIHRLFASSICYISNQKQMRAELRYISNYVTTEDKHKINLLLAHL